MSVLDDERIDAAVEAFARPQPPEAHVAQVLARSGPGTGARGQADALRAGRWMAPVAATAVIALGAAWLASRPASDLVTPPAAPLDIPADVDRPVLPPQAYWGMDAFEEWETLLPGRGSRVSGTGHRGPGTGNSATTGRTTGARRATVPQLAWVPIPSGLPPIELESIAPAPLVVPPLASLEDISLAEIPLAPIAIDPIASEERP